MKSKVVLKALAFTLILIFCCRDLLLCAPRQTANQSQSSDKIKAAVQARGVGEKAKVIVKMQNQKTRKGYISSVGEESFVLMEAATNSPSSISYADVIEVRKPGLSKGAKIGLFAFVWVIVGIISKYTL